MNPTCPVCSCDLVELVRHVGVCRGDEACRCPDRSLDCIACRMAHPPAMVRGRRPLLIQDFSDRHRQGGFQSRVQTDCIAKVAPLGGELPLPVRLRQARQQAGLSQAALGRKLKPRRSQTMIALWEHGRPVPPEMEAQLWRALKPKKQKERKAS